MQYLAVAARQRQAGMCPSRPLLQVRQVSAAVFHCALALLPQDLVVLSRSALVRPQAVTAVLSVSALVLDVAEKVHAAVTSR